MKKFIVIQIKVDKEVCEGYSNNILLSNVVRQIDAENEEMAIGKFVLATKDIEAKQKLNIECYELSKLRDRKSVV